MPDKRKDSLTNNTSKKLKSSDNGSGMSNWLFFYPKNYLLYLSYFFFQFSDTDAGGHMSFDPVHFIRSHSKNNDPADIQTQVRNIFTIDYCFFVPLATIHIQGFPGYSVIFWSPANCTIGKTALIGD